MFYKENYGVYADIIDTGRISVDPNMINTSNYDDHYNWILNIMKDGIETDFIRNAFIEVRFNEEDIIDLSIIDYYFNIIMWYSIIYSNSRIEPWHLYFNDAITRKNIKDFLDDNFIEHHRTTMNIIKLNNIANDSLCRYKDVDIFSMYLANTIDLKSFIDLMNEDPEFNNLIHMDLSNVPLEEINKVGMELTNKIINKITNSNHCLAPFFKAKEGISPKQFKECVGNIGSIPNGRGGIFPYSINTNFLIGGTNDYHSYLAETSRGRTAQIIVENNVGDSGHFARLLKLNNIDTTLHKDPNYICNSNNFIELTILNEDMLSRLEFRYYRLMPNGMEYKISVKDRHLIGKKIYLRSPMTCASAAAGNGICYRCYGDLANINSNISIGIIAAELLSAVLTQMMLSAKHLLEAKVKKLKWKQGFKEFFDIDFNIIRFQDDMEDKLKGYKLLINASEIDLQTSNDDEGGDRYSEYVTSFKLVSPSGEEIEIYTSDLDKMYISYELNDYIREYAEEDNDEYIKLDVSDMISKDINLFMMYLYNMDLSKVLDKVINTIDNVATTTNLNKDQLLQQLLQNIMECKLDLSSIHAEVILSNQLRNKSDILEMPNWNTIGEDYQVLTLKQSLSNNPRVAISLAYQDIKKMLYNPLTFRKYKASSMDLFYMEQPQKFLDDSLVVKNTNKQNESGLKTIMTKIIEEEIEEDE